MSFSVGPRWNALSPLWANAWPAGVSSRTYSWSAVPPWPWPTTPRVLPVTLMQTFVPHGVVIEEARHVAEDLGLPLLVAERAGKHLNLGKGRPRQAPGVRSSWAARVSSIASTYLRDEGARSSDTRRRRSPRACRHHRGGVSRRSRADLRGRTSAAAVCCRPARTPRVSTEPTWQRILTYRDSRCLVRDPHIYRVEAVTCCHGRWDGF
jgi:hypothetical protein